MLCDDKRSLVNPINTIIVGKEATYYGKEILNECYHALKGKNWTQVEAMSKIKETLYNMKNKDKWTVTENLKNLISLVIQFRAVQAMNEKDPDYKYLLLIQIAYYITVNGEKENVSTLLDTFHNLNINMNKGLHLGRLKIILASGIIATNTSLQNFINKTFKPTKIISSIQYFRYITYGRKTFNHEVLKEIADQYTNCTYYENQTSRVLTLMEAFQAPKFNAFLKANNVDDFEHHLINSKELPPFFKRTQQMLCDSVLISKAIQQYCDIKSFIGLTVIRCRVALFHNNTPTCNKLLSQLLTTMSKCIQDNGLSQKHPITAFFNEIKLIHKLNPKDRMGSIFFDPQYEKLKISFVIDAGNDPTFDAFYEECLRNKIEFYAKDMDLISFFPNDCSINEDTTNNVKDLLEKLLTNNKLPINEKYLEFKKIQDSFDVNPKLPSTAICSRIVETPVDTYFDEFCTENPDVIHEITQLGKTINLKEHFPDKTQISNIITWKTTILDMIEKLPPAQKEIALENYHKFIEWEL
jgi:hypothetical protein